MPQINISMLENVKTTGILLTDWFYSNLQFLFKICDFLERILKYSVHGFPAGWPFFSEVIVTDYMPKFPKFESVKKVYSG